METCHQCRPRSSFAHTWGPGLMSPNRANAWLEGLSEMQLWFWSLAREANRWQFLSGASQPWDHEIPLKASSLSSVSLSLSFSGLLSLSLSLSLYLSFFLQWRGFSCSCPSFACLLACLPFACQLAHFLASVCSCFRSSSCSSDRSYLGSHLFSSLAFLRVVAFSYPSFLLAFFPSFFLAFLRLLFSTLSCCGDSFFCFWSQQSVVLCLVCLLQLVWLSWLLPSVWLLWLWGLCGFFLACSACATLTAFMTVWLPALVSFAFYAFYYCILAMPM